MNPIELKDLAKLLDFGAKCFEQQKIIVEKLRGAKKVLFPMFVAAHNYAEGIYSLCRENRSHPCFSLLRSLCDNLINAKFLYCSPKKHAHVIYLDSLIEKRKQLDHAQKFLTRKPQYLVEIKVSIKELEKVLKKIEIQERQARTKIDAFPGSLIMGLQERAKYVDSHNTNKNRKSYSLEWIYILVFRNLSSSTHINFLDFHKYFKSEEREVVVFLSGNPDDIGEILALLDYLYKELLITFLKAFKSPMIRQFERDYKK